MPFLARESGNTSPPLLPGKETLEYLEHANEELDARTSLWVMYASALLMVGQMTGVEQKLQAAEKALQGAELDDKTKDLSGHIAPSAPRWL
jgi:LuxR family maltose regulon positive regulatory protein